MVPCGLGVQDVDKLLLDPGEEPGSGLEAGQPSPLGAAPEAICSAVLRAHP